MAPKKPIKSLAKKAVTSKHASQVKGGMRKQETLKAHK
jgi:hypothetical protein